jgi:two-component system response regulator DegU
VDKITVMVIDEQEFFRAGVSQTLSQQSDFEVIDCDPTQDPLELIEAHLPDVALLGSDLATLSGLELGRKITRLYPNTKVIMLSPNPDDEELFEIIKTAAVACLNKKASAEELVSTIRRARNGEYPINESLTRPTVAKRVLKQFQDIAIQKAVGKDVGRAMEAAAAPLTNRETQILNYIAQGNSNKQIAYTLDISEQTIKNHVSSILRKLNANDRAHAVALAMRNGWLLAEEKQ